MRKLIYILLVTMAMSCNSSYDVILVMDSADVIPDKTKVTVHGIEVGAVSAIELTDDLKVAATLSIMEGVKLHKGAEFEIQSVGVFGSSAITIREQSRGELLIEGDTVYISTSVRTKSDSTLLKIVSGLFENPSKRDSIHQKLESIEKRVENLEKRLIEVER